MFLPGLLGAVERMPGLTLLCTDQDLHGGDFAELTPNFDIVVADSPNLLPSWKERRLVVVQLLTEPLDVAMPIGHPLAAKSSLTAADLVNETWIGIPGVSPYGRVLRHIEAVNGSPARVSQRFLDNGIVEAVVAAGHGIAILPRYTTRDHDNGLVTRPLRDIRASRLISALLRPDRAVRPSVRAVVDVLRDGAKRFEAAHQD
jgi:DNA-binding transcriptional LysR family regulator